MPENVTIDASMFMLRAPPVHEVNCADLDRMPPSAPAIMWFFRTELALWFSIATALLFVLFRPQWLSGLANVVWLVTVFVWLFAAILWSAFAVVRHADCLAIRLGEPYGTLILTFSVISIEIMMIAAVMITGVDKPGLARDTMFSVLMIVLNGMIGASLLLGALRYREQQYNLQGANAFLAVIVPLAIVGLILPNYTLASAGPTFSSAQALSLVVMTVGIYAVFLSIETVRHRSDFIEPVDASSKSGLARVRNHVKLSPRSVPYHAVLLLCYLLPVVVLSKKLAVPINLGITVLGAPPALGGFIVAVLVLSPEGLGAIHAALENQLQRAVNIFLGSALATISLTIPAVLVIGLVTGEPVILGLEPEESVMLVLTLMVSIITFGSGRTNVLLGAVHLLLFFTYFMLIFD
jgi:Ca2+:H+ antiporter